VSPLPSMSRPSRLPSAVTKAKRSVSDHHERETLGVSGYEHAYAGRVIGRLLRLANFVELSKVLPVRVEVSSSRWSDSSRR
jgi:hypothetical protein